LEPKRARLIVVGCAQMFTNNFITSGTHWLLVSNCVAALTLGEELISIRGKTSSDLSIRETDPEGIPRREGPRWVSATSPTASLPREACRTSTMTASMSRPPLLLPHSRESVRAFGTNQENA
jgi:hypothetical protein